MPSLSGIAHNFPITGKLNPVRMANWRYLLLSAAVTRYAVGLVRIEENRPSRLKNPDMTPMEKKRAFAERCFMELFGTAAYMFLLHLGQDVAAFFLERSNKGFIENVKKQALKDIKEGKYPNLTEERFSKAFDKITGTQTKGIVSRVLYGVSHNGELVRASRREYTQELGIPVNRINEELPEVINKTMRKTINGMSMVAIIVGVLFSAIAGGYGIQWLNDNPFSKFLKRRYPEQAPNGFLTLPSSTNGQFGNQPQTNPFAKKSLTFGGKA